MVLEKLARQWKKRFKKGEKFTFIVQEHVDSHDVLLAKPYTYMNRSGLAVEHLIHRYDVQLKEMLVICDDLNLPLGRIRLRKKGSHGGQKGLASIIDTLGTEEFSRLRLGIGFNEESEASEFVLSRFRRSESAVVGDLIERGGKAVTDFVTMGIDRTMNIYNTTANSQKEH
jgi:PTH1 family peptidyl-tRNA hydrolase